MNRTLRIFGVLAAAGLALAGCGTMTVNPIAQFVDDAATTSAIKSRLATEAGLGSMTGIGVKTSDDVVWLTGTVANEAERQRVEAIARRIAGDNRVMSDLRVAASASASAASVQTAPAPTPPIQKTSTTQKPTVQK
jgi:BON domain